MPPPDHPAIILTSGEPERTIRVGIQAASEGSTESRRLPIM
jgi:hypothetical protein